MNGNDDLFESKKVVEDGQDQRSAMSVQNDE